MNRRLILLATAVSILSACATDATTPTPGSQGQFTPVAITSTMRQVADWQIDSWSTNGFAKPKYNWTYCAAYTGIFQAGLVTGDGKYHDFLRKVGDDLQWRTGNRRYFADDYCVGQVFSQLYAQDRQPKMIGPWRTLADEIISKPDNESLSLATRDIMEREWAWCDALFMGPTSLAYLSTVTGERKYLDTALKLWWKTSDFLYSPEERLYFRDESYFDKREKNGKKVFWSRGNGWVMAGMVRVLSNMPSDHPGRARLLGQYRDMAARIAGLQTADGTWHASLLDPASFPVKETSGTAFYTYAILWGLNNGVLDRATYWPVVEKAWPALVSAVQTDGKLGYVQPVGAAPDKVDANSTETYGPGAFLLAGSELLKFVNQ
ncbi:glycoside hydrolase family 88/105 protein [Pseudoduganella lutea]|nr:glycoside hydrolase family 88 protein [Pseudoduganella lutea]